VKNLQEELNELCARAVLVWGSTAQLRLLQEECGELIAAINHSERGRIEERELADEIADVIITVTQATHVVGAKHVADALAHKLARLRGRIEATEKRLELEA
jgi:NTP pyrophosphatase (non-canonical NTP hydrolase)